MVKKTITLYSICMLCFMLLPIGKASAQVVTAHSSDDYKLIKTIQGPSIPPSNLTGKAWCTDINYFDALTNKYYVTDTNNKQVDVVDGKTRMLLSPIGKGDFTGPGDCLTGDYSSEGPTGVVAADNLNQLWVGNGDSTVKVYNLHTGSFIKQVSTGGAKRADELAYDAADHRIIVTNPDEKDSHNNPTPFYTIIDASTVTVIGGHHQVTDATSLEQPQWDRRTDLFYMSVPATTGHAGGEVAVINPMTGVASPTPFVLNSDCVPSGLSINERRQEAVVGCFGSVEIISLKDGAIRATISQINQVDEVWYNWGDNRYYLGSFDLSGHTYIGVVDASGYHFITKIQINDPNEHAVAVDPFTNDVYIPVSGKGIEVFHASHEE